VKNARYFAANIFERSIEDAVSGVENDCPIGGQQIELGPDSFPHTALQAIAFDRLAERARNGEAEAGGCRYAWRM